MKKLTQQLQFNIAGSKLSSATNTGFGVTWVPKTGLIEKEKKQFCFSQFIGNCKMMRTCKQLIGGKVVLKSGLIFSF